MLKLTLRPTKVIYCQKSRTAIEFASLAKKKKKIHTSQSRARIRKLPVLDHMSHVVKIDIPTGHEETGDMNFILKIIFHCIFIEKTMHFL